MVYIDRDTTTEAIRQRTEKRCRTCQEIKPLESFYADASRTDGREYACIKCQTSAPTHGDRKRGRPAGSTKPDAEKSRHCNITLTPEAWAKASATGNASAYIERLILADN